MKTLLIANRGEIALRVMRTAARLGIRTVALYTDLDRTAPHVGAADEARRVSSYLDIDEVVERVEGVATLADRLQGLLNAVVSISSQLDLDRVLHTVDRVLGF